MTREEAKELAENMLVGDYDGKVPKKDKFVDKIYDSLDVEIKLAKKIIENESIKVCENCKYLKTEICSLGIQHFEINTNPEAFGCVKFERIKF